AGSRASGRAPTRARGSLARRARAPPGARDGCRTGRPSAGAGRRAAAVARASGEDAVLEEGAVVLARREGTQARARAEGEGHSLLEEGALARSQDARRRLGRCGV